MLEAVALYHEVGATLAAEQLGVTPQTIYNALRAYKQRMAAVTALGQPSDLHTILDEQQARWEERQGPNARQRRYAARPSTQGAGQTNTRRTTTATGRGSRLPAHLRHFFAQLKGSKTLCAALMTTMRREAIQRGHEFSGWTDVRMAQEISRLTDKAYVRDLPRIARALCLEWEVRKNEHGNWIPDLPAPSTR